MLGPEPPLFPLTGLPLNLLQGLVWAGEVHYGLHQELVATEEVYLQGLVQAGEVCYRDLHQELVATEEVDFWLHSLREVVVDLTSGSTHCGKSTS